MNVRSNSCGTFLIVVSVALVTVATLWQFQETPDEAYERGRENRDSLWIAIMQEMTDKLAGQFDPTDTMPAVDSVDTPWFWSDSAVMNDEHWICPNDEGWGFLPSCVLRDSLSYVCILRFPDMIIFWDTKLMDGTNIYRASSWMTLEE